MNLFNSNISSRCGQLISVFYFPSILPVSIMVPSRLTHRDYVLIFQNDVCSDLFNFGFKTPQTVIDMCLWKQGIMHTGSITIMLTLLMLWNLNLFSKHLRGQPG